MMRSTHRDSLHYDRLRQVLELRPQSVRPFENLWRDELSTLEGNIYYVSTKTGLLTVRRCDGSEQLVLCETRVFAAASGMAIDSRGLLYVADSLGQCVVVIDPDARSIQDVFGHNQLVDPVDIAIGDQHIYVVDRAAGYIFLFNFQHGYLDRFIPQNAEGLPQPPQPIAVILEVDGNLLVVDAAYPRLLRFATDNRPLPEVELSNCLDRALGCNLYRSKHYAKVIDNLCRSPLVRIHPVLAASLSSRFVTDG